MATQITTLALLLGFAASAAWAAPSRPQSVQERYFAAGWAASPDALAPAPAAAAGAAQAAPEPDKPVGVEHAQIAHMYITREAYKIYEAQFPGTELERYIGDYDYATSKPLVRDDGNVVTGAYDEDEFYDNPFGQKESYFRHFWDPYGGYGAGLGGFDSSLERAHKYLTGGFGVEGGYDRQWSENGGAKRGTKGHGAVWLYQHGEKAKAYWYLGHIAHLLEDLTVPAHAHLFAHVIDWMDAYETYMTKAHVRWPVDTSRPVEEFPTLLELFAQTGRVTARFDCGNGGGLTGGVDGTVDRGRRRSGGFTKAKLDEEGNTLMPLAFSRVAALYRFFYAQVDKTPPTVILTSPDGSSASEAPRRQGRLVLLAAEARDDESGLDRGSLSYRASAWTGAGWSAWRPVSGNAFLAERDGLYRFEARAKDAAGNLGRSQPKYLRVEATDARRICRAGRR